MNIIFENPYIFVVKNIQCRPAFQQINVYSPMINFRGTHLSVEMLKGYLVRERLGTPGLQYIFMPRISLISETYSNRIWLNMADCTVSYFCIAFIFFWLFVDIFLIFCLVSNVTSFKHLRLEQYIFDYLAINNACGKFSCLNS